jgi:hypothetical protein
MIASYLTGSACEEKRNRNPLSTNVFPRGPLFMEQHQIADHQLTSSMCGVRRDRDEVETYALESLHVLCYF